ncbi:18.1 kDa class I heat shock protein-like [Musa acuminata AAA Group]|uniref:18.1 kDa class I heat shock protein-like n=1 Tax=Musa acuminata AAA Group TaxID=214697 RepID=UPI0031D4B67B
MSLAHNLLLGCHSNIFDALRGFPSDDSGADDIRMDWKETPEAHVFKADLPGVRKGDVKVEVEDGRVLSISGERSGDPIDHKEKCEWHCSERSRGRFYRRFRLPEDAKADEMKASIENGVLTLIVPKRQMKKPEARSVEITGGAASKKRGKEKDVVCCSFWPL